ncbi:hypothetical protein [Flavihumibacter profundi]|uniref:hypothetical protein n=1 Tax=Flavihumibacter profundi TaxID=2716883 RepID=UPI001CC36DBA|nr:hypothetical protein [Flavihumibacter profundi]MBZ5856579.1 hypothetical protein [Flavihumibacter profundi]
MYNGLLHLHSLMRWIILVLLVLAIVRHYKGMNQKLSYSASDRKIDLFLMISAHITLIIGLYQWFAGEFGFSKIRDMGFGEVMKNAPFRFFAVEHMFGMLLAITFITIGRGKGKPATAGAAEHKKAFGWLLVALIIILLTVPWPFREGIGRPWFPGMH